MGGGVQGRAYPMSYTPLKRGTRLKPGNEFGDNLYSGWNGFDTLRFGFSLPCTKLNTSTNTNSIFVYFSGLSFNEEFLLRLLKFLQELGPDGGLNLILNCVSSEDSQMSTSVQSLLILFCECCSHLIP